MPIPTIKSSPTLRAGALVLCAAVAITATLTAATKQRPIKKLLYDPNAPVVALFEGIEQEMIEATLIPKSSLEGNVFIENKTKRPLTVKFPKAVAASQVLKQGFGGGMGGGGGRGGQQGGGMGGGMMGGMGGGFFSIPPEKTVQFPITTVCLNHGKAEPKPKMTYRLIKLEDYTSDPVLQEVLVAVGTGKFNNDKQAAQAATWYLTDKMSWEKLADKKIERLGGAEDDPYFSQTELMAARQIVVQAQSQARKRDVDKDESGPSKNRVPEKNI